MDTRWASELQLHPTPLQKPLEAKALTGVRLTQITRHALSELTDLWKSPRGYCFSPTQLSSLTYCPGSPMLSQAQPTHTVDRPNNNIMGWSKFCQCNCNALTPMPPDASVLEEELDLCRIIASSAKVDDL